MDRLIALTLGELPDEEAAPIEEHILACGDCAGRVERLLQIARAVPEMVRSGRFAFAATTELFEELQKSRLVTRVYDLHPGSFTACTVAARDVYTGVRYHADLSGVERVDVIREAEGEQVQRLEDVPVDREHGWVHIVLRVDVLRTTKSGSRKARLVAVDAEGERELAHYDLQHTAFQPER
jgi:hypothetical protein